MPLDLKPPMNTFKELISPQTKAEIENHKTERLHSDAGGILKGES
jgi:hypothetical protein